jgi:hypothetical protein
MSDEDKGKVFLMIVFTIASCALLYSVFRSLKSGKVAWFSRSTSIMVSRESDPNRFWNSIIQYALIGVAMLTLSVYAIFRILARTMLH